MTDPVYSRAALAAKDEADAAAVAIVYVGRTGAVHYVVHADDAELAAALEDIIEGAADDLAWEPGR